MGIVRPPEHYLHGDGQVVIVPARVCAFLNKYADLEKFRREHRGGDADVDSVLVAFRVAELKWQQATTGTKQAAEPELAADSKQWLRTTQAAARLGITDRAVRKAIQTGRLQATNVAGRWRISREDFEHYKASRSKY